MVLIFVYPGVAVLECDIPMLMEFPSRARPAHRRLLFRAIHLLPDLRSAHALHHRRLHRPPAGRVHAVPELPQGSVRLQLQPLVSARGAGRFHEAVHCPLADIQPLRLRTPVSSGVNVREVGDDRGLATDQCLDLDSATRKLTFLNDEFSITKSISLTQLRILDVLEELLEQTRVPAGVGSALQVEAAAGLLEEVPYLRESFKSALQYIERDMSNIQGLAQTVCWDLRWLLTILGTVLLT